MATLVRERPDRGRKTPRVAVREVPAVPRKGRPADLNKPPLDAEGAEGSTARAGVAATVRVAATAAVLKAAAALREAAPAAGRAVKVKAPADSRAQAESRVPAADAEDVAVEAAADAISARYSGRRRLRQWSSSRCACGSA